MQFLKLYLLIGIIAVVIYWLRLLKVTGAVDLRARQWAEIAKREHVLFTTAAWLLAWPTWLVFWLIERELPNFTHINERDQL